jgi:hypothetical protein
MAPTYFHSLERYPAGHLGKQPSRRICRVKISRAQRGPTVDAVRAHGHEQPVTGFQEAERTADALAERLE